MKTPAGQRNRGLLERVEDLGNPAEGSTEFLAKGLGRSGIGNHQTNYGGPLPAVITELDNLFWTVYDGRRYTELLGRYNILGPLGWIRIDDILRPDTGTESQLHLRQRCTIEVDSFLLQPGKEPCIMVAFHCIIGDDPRKL
jgi:hypothetical protein